MDEAVSDYPCQEFEVAGCRLRASYRKTFRRLKFGSRLDTTKSDIVARVAGYRLRAAERACTVRPWGKILSTEGERRGNGGDTCSHGLALPT